MQNLAKMPVLVLNASYEPINVVCGRRALTVVMKDIATVEEKSHVVITVKGKPYAVPAVIRFREYRKLPDRARLLSRKGIMERDRQICQYCHQHASIVGRLTLDHIIPRSRGGASTWENLVAACSPCNTKKDNRTPDEAGMPLRRYPKPFTVHTGRHLLRDSAANIDSWRKYTFYENTTPQETVL